MIFFPNTITVLIGVHYVDFLRKRYRISVFKILDYSVSFHHP